MSINRRDFLAFIPTISAIPFIGKSITQTDSGIFIAQPEPVKPIASIDKLSDLEVRLYANGKHVGNAWIENISINMPIPAPRCHDHTYDRGKGDMRIECVVVNHRELIKNTFNL